MIRHMLVVVLALAIAGEAAAQSAPPPVYVVTRAEITLKSCDRPQDMFIVIGHNDRNEHRVKDGDVLSLDLDPSDRFDAADTYARIRFGDTVTDCQKSSADLDPVRNVFIGRFVLTCRSGKASRLTISAPDDVDISYVRGMREARPCWLGSTIHGTGEIRAVLFSDETVRLQFDRDRPDPQSLGLLIRDPSVLADVTKPAVVELSRDQIVAAFAAQRNGGRMSAPPTNAPNGQIPEQAGVTKALTTLRLELNRQ